MEKLLKIAKDLSEQAEVYYSHCAEDTIIIEDTNIKTIKSCFISGHAVRLIKNGKIGLAYTSNLLDRESLVVRALNSAEAGAKADFDFPKSENIETFNNCDQDIQQIDKNQLINEAKEVLEYIKSKSDAQVNMHIYTALTQREIMNCSGTRLTEFKSWFTFYLWLPFPESASNLTYIICTNKPKRPMDKAKIDSMLDLYALKNHPIEVKSGKMKVILMPEPLNSLIARFNEAAHPFYFENKTTPLLNKFGEKIFSDKLTIFEDPLDKSEPEYSTFDGEGVAKQKTVFVENGVFKSIYTDLNFANKLNFTPTGHGSRSDFKSQISPNVSCYSVATGDKSLSEMIAEIDEGIIVYSLMDTYSGNILVGDYTISISTGFYIKNGKLIGKVKECMITGNIYETLNQISAIENETHYFGYGNFPAISFEEMSVTGSDFRE